MTDLKWNIMTARKSHSREDITKQQCERTGCGEKSELGKKKSAINTSS